MTHLNLVAGSWRGVQSLHRLDGCDVGSFSRRRRTQAEDRRRESLAGSEARKPGSHGAAEGGVGERVAGTHGHWRCFAGKRLRLLLLEVQVGLRLHLLLILQLLLRKSLLQLVDSVVDL